MHIHAQRGTHDYARHGVELVWRSREFRVKAPWMPCSPGALRLTSHEYQLRQLPTPPGPSCRPTKTGGTKRLSAEELKSGAVSWVPRARSPAGTLCIQDHRVLDPEKADCHRGLLNRARVCDHWPGISFCASEFWCENPGGRGQNLGELDRLAAVVLC